MPPPQDAKIALEAYNRLGANLGWLSKKTAAWLRENAGGIPAGFIEVGFEPVTRLLDSPVGTLGVVLFPEGPEPGKSPAREQVEAVLAAGRSLKGKGVLILGVSPWGYVGERDFLAQAQDVFDCLLGGGEGVGFPGTVTQKAPGVLWLRPDGKGRAVNVLELYFHPEAGRKTPWVENRSFKANLEFLDQRYPVDPRMQSIVGNVHGAE